jgi:hypothetical protein
MSAFAKSLTSQSQRYGDSAATADIRRSFLHAGKARCTLRRRMVQSAQRMSRIRFLIFFSIGMFTTWAWAADVPVASSAPVASSSTVETSSGPAAGPFAVHGIHLTSSAAGSKRYRLKLDAMLHDTIINTVVVDLKEEGGEVYVPGVQMAERVHSYQRAIPDLAAWVADLKKRHIYTVGRVVVFKDNIMPRKTPSVAVHNNNGEVWYDRKHTTWMDPYNRDAWRYILVIALKAAQLGFDEIQFDYIRFPTDGALAQMHFAKPYSRQAASQNLVDFLAEARQLLHPMGVKISIDVFGLTTSVNTGMGIGQQMGPMAEQVDYVCPMTYPSHYNKGEYGLANPNDQPYRTIHLAMHDAIKLLGPDGNQKLRPYLQDFSLKGRGIPYRAKEVRAQMQAAADVGVMSWTLWNANCHYTLDALRQPVVPMTEPVVKTSSSSTVTPSK